MKAVVRKSGFGEPAVLDAGKLVGVIITKNVCEVFFDHWEGYREGAARIDIVSDQDKFDIAGALAIIAEQGAEILGLGIYRERWKENAIFYVRLRSAMAEHVAEILRTKGYNVLGAYF
jgi:hypothetical protein